MEEHIYDYYGNSIQIGDVVSFPTGADFMDGVVEKIRINKRNSAWSKIYVKNTSGYKKWKQINNVINRSAIEKLQEHYNTKEVR